MPEAINTIPTRQLADPLAGTTTPLGTGGSFTSDIFEVDGYDTIGILGISDQAFTVQVLEACDPKGTFVVTRTLTSAPDGLGQQNVCVRLQPCGSYMKFVLANTGGAPMGTLSFCAIGIPLP